MSDEGVWLSCEIIDSLTELVGEKITPALIQTVEDICLSHLREHGVYESQGLDELLKQMARRAKLKFPQ